MNKKEIHSPLVITKGWPYQTIAKEYKYKAFGEMKYESGTYDNTHKFTGKEEDGTGLYYYGARYYDKSIGRFISIDPVLNLSGTRYNIPDAAVNPGAALNLHNPQDLNPFVYCRNSPLRLVDPDGEAVVNLEHLPIIQNIKAKQTQLAGATGTGEKILLNLKLAWLHTSLLPAPFVCVQTPSMAVLLAQNAERVKTFIKLLYKTLFLKAKKFPLK